VSKRPNQIDLLDAALCKTFADNVLRLREERKLTQAQLAAASDLSRAVISEIETGAHPNVTLRSVRRIAAGLGTTIHELLTE
jgi:transcriptional regulator with XRE-family HTH domain